LPDQEKKEDPVIEYIVLVGIGETDENTGKRKPSTAAPAHETASSLNDAFERLHLSGSEAHFAWIRGALDSLERTAVQALAAMGLDPLSIPISVDAALDVDPLLSLSGQDDMERAARAIAEHHDRARPFHVPDVEHAVRVCVALVHAKQLKEVMGILWAAPENRGRLEMRLRPAKAYVLERKPGRDRYAWHVM